MMPDFLYDLLEGEARDIFADLMAEEDVPEEEWEFLFEGFLDQYVEAYAWENRGF